MKRTLARMQQILSGRGLRGRQRRMRLCETLSLGERRFLALVRVDQHEFLIGGAGSTVALVSNLPDAPVTAQDLLQTGTPLEPEGRSVDKD